jgi:hypothetical protein
MWVTQSVIRGLEWGFQVVIDGYVLLTTHTRAALGRSCGRPAQYFPVHEVCPDHRLWNHGQEMLCIPN